MRTGALLCGVWLIAGCPGEVGQPKREIMITLPDGPARDGPASVTDGPKPSVDGKPKTPDGKPKLPDSKPKLPDQAKPAQDWGANDIGKPCTGNGDCIYGLCAQNTHTGVWFCTKACDPCTASPCPAGSGCQNAGPFYICAPGYPNAPCP